MKYIVNVIDYDTGEVVQSLQYDSEKSAERGERGIRINLNHEQFCTEIVRAAAAIGEQP